MIFSAPVKAAPGDSHQINEKIALIHTENHQYIHNSITGLLSHKQDADDICQNFYLSLLEQPDTPILNNQRPLLYLGLKRKTLDWVRQQQNSKNKAAEYAIETQPTANRRYTTSSTLDQVTANETRVALIQAIKTQLTPRFANMLQMRYQQGLTHLQIAKKLNITILTSRRYTYIALKRMRKIIKENPRYNALRP